MIMRGCRPYSDDTPPQATVPSYCTPWRHFRPQTLTEQHDACSFLDAIIQWDQPHADNTDSTASLLVNTLSALRSQANCQRQFPAIATSRHVNH